MWSPCLLLLLLLLLFVGAFDASVVSFTLFTCIVGLASLSKFFWAMTWYVTTSVFLRRGYEAINWKREKKQNQGYSKQQTSIAALKITCLLSSTFSFLGFCQQQRFRCFGSRWFGSMHDAAYDIGVFVSLFCFFVCLFVCLFCFFVCLFVCLFFCFVSFFVCFFVSLIVYLFCLFLKLNN